MPFHESNRQIRLHLRRPAFVNCRSRLILEIAAVKKTGATVECSEVIKTVALLFRIGTFPEMKRSHLSRAVTVFAQAARQCRDVGSRAIFVVDDKVLPPVPPGEQESRDTGNTADGWKTYCRTPSLRRRDGLLTAFEQQGCRYTQERCSVADQKKQTEYWGDSWEFPYVAMINSNYARLKERSPNRGLSGIGEGVSIVFLNQPLDLLVCAYHNLTDCGTEGCQYLQRCVLT